MRLSLVLLLGISGLAQGQGADRYQCRFTSTYTGAPSYSFMWDGTVPKVFQKGNRPGVRIRFQKGDDPLAPKKLSMVLEVLTTGSKYVVRETVYRGQKSLGSAFRTVRKGRTHSATFKCSNSKGTLKVYKKIPKGEKFVCDAQLGINQDMGSVSYTIDPFRSGTQSVTLPVGAGRLEVRPQVSRRSTSGGYTYTYSHSLYYRASSRYCYMGVSGGMDISQGDFQSEYLSPGYSDVCPDFGLIRCRWSKPPWPPE